MFQKKRIPLAAVLLLAIAGSLYFGAINPDKFGFYHDDGIYLVTAKALATGQGYKILSLPNEPWQTKYPPVFPLAISSLWWINPDFPDNIFLFFAFSALSTLLFLALATVFLLKGSYASPIQALLILIVTAMNWRTVILATSILSEAFFAALIVCAIWLAFNLDEKLISKKNLALGILMALAALTRLAGISLLAAILLYALTHRQIRRFLIPTALASVMIAGWFWWCHLHQTSSLGSHVAYYTNYFQDWQSLLQSDKPGIQSSLLGSLSVMVGRNIVTMLSTIPVVCLGIQINKLPGMIEAWQFPAILIGLFVLIMLVIGFCKTRSVGNGLLHYFILSYIALHLLWPYTIYDRALIPILPFVLYFIFSGGASLWRGCLRGYPPHRRLAKATSMLFIFTILASLFAAGFLGLASGFHDQIKDSKTAYAANAKKKLELIDWLKNHSRADDILTCYQDPVYFLYTGRKAIRLPSPDNNEPSMLYADRLLKFAKENRVTLLLQGENDFSLQSYSVNRRSVLAGALDNRPLYFAPVYSTSNLKGTIYQIASREAFNAK